MPTELLAEKPMVGSLNYLVSGLQSVDTTHQLMVSQLAKPGEAILESLAPEDCHLMHMAVGVCGEAGELMDAVKKAVIYRKPLDRNNVIEELGDLEFYMEGIRTAIGVSRDAVLQANITKLRVRYPNAGYSDRDAVTRADK